MLDKYKYIVDNSKDFITLINRDYVYEIVNQTYCEATGRNREEILGARVADVWGEETFFGTIKGYLDRCFAGEYVHYVEQFKFGSYAKYMHVSYYPYYEGEEISHAIVFSHDITHIGRLENKLNHYEYRDPVTGLFNRRSLNVILERELERAERSERDRLRGMLFIDILLEKVIQFHGQESGDLLLENTGMRIKSQLRGSDYIFRYDGNRFVVLLSNLHSVLDAGAVSDKIHRAVTLPYKFRNGTVILDCYIGAAVYPNDAQDKEQLVHNALSAVLEARRRELAFLLYDVHLHGQALRRIYLEGATQRALEEQQFRLVFQPIVDMEYRIVAAEALLRWEHPQMGTIAPYDFIPMAEQTNLISKIGRWVLHRVCEKLAEWERRYDLGVSVNISGKEFSSGDLREEIRTAAACSGLHDLSRLKVEITETTCVRNLEESSRYMRELEELGVQLYIDDFGTGESSLRYLKRIPAGVLKIDKEFVDEIASDPDQLEFLIHIIRMIKARGKRVIVEGVGEEAQAVRLAETACDYMQGFYFSRPLEIEAFEELLAKRRCLPAAED